MFSQHPNLAKNASTNNSTYIQLLTVPRWPPGYERKGPKTNRRESKNNIRAEWVGTHAEGASIRQIAADCHPSPATVSYNIRKANERENHESKPRSGCPRKTTNRDDRRLVREAIEKGKRVEDSVLPRLIKTSYLIIIRGVSRRGISIFCSILTCLLISMDDGSRRASSRLRYIDG